MEVLNLFHSTALTDKSSVFRGHAVRVKNSQEIRLAYNRIKLTYPESDHIISAYHVKSHWGHHDDGEHGAARRLLKILEDRMMSNVAVFVTREYGGIHLGPRRYINIEKVAREVLNEMHQAT